ncbi:MAG TPA: hypothetical protein VNA89_05335, partial [Gemmatimonadaceae bacterium]|nr:hypothetical protein [Gemmatimonadaceae bacterium]
QEVRAMSADETTTAPAPAARGDATVERRKRAALRKLIDEMMEQIRAMANESTWTPEARERAEADLARIMESVRRQATAGS